jgi:hypothetical protein
MARLKGTSVQDVLENQAYDAHIEDWVEVTLPWSARGTNAKVVLRKKFKKIANIKFPPQNISQDGVAITEAKAGATLEEEAVAFFENVAGDGKATAGRVAIVTEMDEKIRGGVQ